MPEPWQIRESQVEDTNIVLPGKVEHFFRISHTFLLARASVNQIEWAEFRAASQQTGFRNVTVYGPPAYAGWTLPASWPPTEQLSRLEACLLKEKFIVFIGGIKGFYLV
jgi:hypothetical protein